MTSPEIVESALVGGSHAATPGSDDPLAGFTSTQWYFHQARQTVFFAAFSSQALDDEQLGAMAADIIDHVPQIGALYSAFNGGTLPRGVLDRIITCDEVDDLSAYPDAWDVSCPELFSRHDLPMLRLRAVVRRDGPDAVGRRSALMVLSTHALLEGADSALLSRSQSASHGDLAAPIHQKQWIEHLGHWLNAAALGPAQLLVALAIAPRRTNTVYRSLVFERTQLRRIATRFGMSQRILLFALVLFALNRGGKGLSRRKISALYTVMDTWNRAGGKNAYFRFWTTEARFRVSSDFAVFAKNISAEIKGLEASDKKATQGLLEAVFSAHRIMRRWLPFLYSDRIFRFSGFYDISLSVTPPHRMQGPLTEGLQDPVYVGTFHPGLSQCTFAPGRRHITANFTVHRKHLPGIDAIAALLDALDS